MCQIIVINNGDKQIETPSQLISHFSLNQDKIDKHFDSYEKSKINMEDCCLCSVDLDLLFSDLEVKFIEIDGDYYVEDPTHASSRKINNKK